MSTAAGAASPATSSDRTWSAETTLQGVAPSATRSSPGGSATAAARPSTSRCTLAAVTHDSGSIPGVTAPAKPEDTISAGRPASPARAPSQRSSAAAARSGPTPVVSTPIPDAPASAMPRRQAAASVPVAAQTRITRRCPGPGSARRARRA
jgi:hypothetical protein